jgi:ABC-type transporter Mla subunit MlaD
MSLNDLTPNLRTRLNRVEHVVGVFVLLAALILAAGFCYYVYFTAKKKGWFEVKAPFHCIVDSAQGLSEGQPVTMMGFKVGEITKITAYPAGSAENVYVEFVIKGAYVGYMWTDSKVRLGAGDLLGNRSLEVLKGNWQGGWTNSDGSTVQAIYKVADNQIKEVVTNSGPKEWIYQPWTRKAEPYFMDILEDPALAERASSIVGMAESAMPGILALTNQVQMTLDTANFAMSNLNQRIREFEPILTNANALVAGFKPASTNVSIITGNLTNANGGLGQWLFPTNLTAETQMTLVSVRDTLAAAQSALTNATLALARIDSTVGNTDTNLGNLMQKVGLSLENLAGITSNLNAQVNSNTNMLHEVSDAIRHTDEFVQGLKQFWLFRRTFKRIEEEEK